MAGDLETRTLNGKLLDSGYEVKAAILNELLPEYLTQILIEFARKKYRDVKIVPGELALEGSSWQIKQPSHIVYVKYNKRHHDYKEAVSVVMPEMINKETGEPNSALPLHTIR